MYNSADLNNIKVFSRVIGGLFYYHPSQYDVSGVRTVLALENTGYTQFDVTANAFLNTDSDVLAVWHDELFTGVGEMKAPPWGSVYLDRESVVFGESTLAFRAFLKQYDIEFEACHNEPEDQFGLMLMVVSSLIDAKEFDAVKTLLSVHILPWASHYLTLLEQAAPEGAYYQLALLGQEFLEVLTEEFDAEAIPCKVYFNARS